MPDPKDPMPTDPKPPTPPSESTTPLGEPSPADTSSHVPTPGDPLPLLTAAPHTPQRPLWRGIMSVIVRVYALAILLVVLWCGYAAVSYMVTYVFEPSRVPAGLLKWQGRLDTDALRVANAPGVALAAERAPLAHYHHVEPWYQPDTGNDCTTSGCHLPLPHSKRKEMRAFANLHATFMNCQMCHDKNLTAPAEAAWISLGTGERQPAPALLQLMKLLAEKADAVEKDPASVHPAMIDLLHQAVETAGQDQLLQQLYVQLDTSEPGSPVWRQAVAQLVEALPSHARGDYSAKIAPIAWLQRTPEQISQMQEWARAWQTAAEGSDARKSLSAKIHADVSPKPQGCLACHGSEPGRLDFAALGYTPQRADALRNSQIASVVQRIMQGEPFHLPRLLEGSDDR